MKVVTTDVYDKWLRRLKRKDRRTAARIQMRVDRLITGNPGDAEPIGGGLSELLILLYGGDKASQRRDIEKAHEIAKEWESNGKD